VPESNAVSALALVVPLFPSNRTILSAPHQRSRQKAPIGGSTPTNKATEKSCISEPQDQGSPDHR
jgi:hypothetical protein